MVRTCIFGLIQRSISWIWQGQPIKCIIPSRNKSHANEAPLDSVDELKERKRFRRIIIIIMAYPGDWELRNVGSHLSDHDLVYLEPGIFGGRTVKSEGKGHKQGGK